MWAALSVRRRTRCATTCERFGVRLAPPQNHALQGLILGDELPPTSGRNVELRRPPPQSPPAVFAGRCFPEPALVDHHHGDLFSEIFVKPVPASNPAVLWVAFPTRRNSEATLRSVGYQHDALGSEDLTAICSRAERPVKFTKKVRARLAVL